MKINLRKASAIQQNINEALKALDFNYTVSINEFQTPTAEIEKISKQFEDNLKTREDLLDTLFEIRSAVGEQNNRQGVTANLVELARLEKDISFFSQFVKAPVAQDLATLTGKIKKLSAQEGSADRYYRNETEVVTSVLDADDTEAFRVQVAAAKKRKQKLQDELLTLNVNAEITLSPHAVETLKKADII